MNIIFLDIDGVLNSHLGFIMDGPHNHLNKINCKCFTEAIKEIPDLKIVISSTWRGRGNDIQHFFDFAKKIADFSLLEPIIPYIHEDYATKWLYNDSMHMMRGDEVREWLYRHPETTDYICLDDDSDFYEDQNLLLIDGTYGFLFYDAHFLKWFFGVANHDDRNLIHYLERNETYAIKRREFMEKLLSNGRKA